MSFQAWEFLADYLTMCSRNEPTPHADLNSLHVVDKVLAEPVGANKPLVKAGAIEIGGREGSEPTRYGDWEKSGRCIDF